MGGLKSIITGPPKPKPAPVIAPPAPAPVAPTPEADDEALRLARRKEIARQTQRSGRASTILTDGDGDKLGG